MSLYNLPNISLLSAKPTLPTITMDPSNPKEGDSVKFQCTSKAAPAPILRFKISGTPEESVAGKNQ